MKKGLFSQPMVSWYRQLVRNSKYRWVVLFGTLLYLVSPMDIFPDVVPVLGWVDDGLIATIAITEVTQILIDRKRNLRQAAKDNPPVAATESQGTVIDVDAIALG